ncbi:MAG: YlbF family regulator [Firmicutes bacterium]|nr:YlbF family regulator [Bacillota bacterium]
MEPIKLAEELGKAILASAAYQNYLQRKEVLANDVVAGGLLAAYQKKQWQFAAIQKDKPLTPEQSRELQNDYEQLQNHPVIGAYLAAREDVEELLSAVNAALARTTGMETGMGCSGCRSNCRGSCS